MKKTFEKELPENYIESVTFDAKNKKTVIIFNLVSLLIIAAVIAAAVLIIRPTGFFENYSFLRNCLFIVAMLLYIVLHELVHGIAYKLLTGQKLKFGITFSAAFCGVPDIYVYRSTALISVFAPFTVFSVLFVALLFIFENPWDLTYTAIILGMHLGGCSGDLYDAALLLFKLRDPRTLMRDTGPKQTFYVLKQHEK